MFSYYAPFTFRLLEPSFGATGAPTTFIAIHLTQRCRSNVPVWFLTHRVTSTASRFSKSRNLHLFKTGKSVAAEFESLPRGDRVRGAERVPANPARQRDETGTFPLSRAGRASRRRVVTDATARPRDTTVHAARADVTDKAETSPSRPRRPLRVTRSRRGKVSRASRSAAW